MPDKELFGRFLRALLGLMTVGWVVAALASPPDPFTFLVYLVPAWLLAGAGAAWLVYAGGYDVLRASPAYAPRAPAARATGVFVLLVLLVKIALTFGADLLLGRGAVGYGEGLVTSAVALIVAYVLVFYAGLLGRLRDESAPGDG